MESVRALAISLLAGVRINFVQTYTVLLPVSEFMESQLFSESQEPLFLLDGIVSSYE